MSEFRKRVYRVTQKIPKGKTMSYKEIARLAGFPRAWRAVGNVLSKNENPRVPCYRVIRSDGKLGGPKERIKKRLILLKKEGAL